MKIGECEYHCGECGVIDFCGDVYQYCLCTDERFKDLTEEKYIELAESIDLSGFEDDESTDVRVRYIADKVAELLQNESAWEDESGY